MTRNSILILCTFVFLFSVHAQTALDPENAGPDFLIQGEYAGTLTNIDGSVDSLAAQVMAMGGEGAFRATLLWGGLPGAGWDKQNKLEVSGTTDSNSTEFSGEGFSFTITSSGDRLVGTGPADETITMVKVMRVSSTEGLLPPVDAVVLFDGINTDAWIDGIMDGRNFLEADTKTIQKFGNMTLHLEYRSPFSPQVKYGNRGNSGVYIQNRYECQIYDSFSQQRPLVEADYNGYGIYADGGGGSIYKISAPDVNMTYPPLSWQTFDIQFTAAQYNGSTLVTNPSITVWHNGVQVHNNVDLPNSTGASLLQPGPTDETLFLQGHGSAVFFRNIWVVPENDYPLDLEKTSSSSTLKNIKISLPYIEIFSKGAHTLHIYNLSGKDEFSAKAEGPMEYFLKERINPGIHLLIIKASQGSVTKVVMF